MENLIFTVDIYCPKRMIPDSGHPTFFFIKISPRLKLIEIHDPFRMNPNDSGESLTFPSTSLPKLSICKEEMPKSTEQVIIKCIVVVICVTLKAKMLHARYLILY